MLSLLSISSLLEVRALLIPFTFQLLIVFLIIFQCKIKESIVIFTLYLVVGLLGLPVFSEGGGLSYVFKPSFGYILGFILMVLPIKKVLRIFEKRKITWVNYFISGLFGLFICYVSFFCYTLFIKNIFKVEMPSINDIIRYYILMFIPFDLIKLIIASLSSFRLNKYFGGYNDKENIC